MVLLDGFVTIKSGFVSLTAVPQCRLRSVHLLRGRHVRKRSLQRGLGMISGLNYTTNRTWRTSWRASSAVIKL